MLAGPSENGVRSWVSHPSQCSDCLDPLPLLSRVHAGAQVPDEVLTVKQSHQLECCDLLICSSAGCKGSHDETHLRLQTAQHFGVQLTVLRLLPK